LLQILASFAVAAFAVVIAGWESRPSWQWSYLTWYFFALGGLQFITVIITALSVGRQRQVVLVGAVLFFAIATLAVILTALLMLIPNFRSSFLNSCFTPFVSADYRALMILFEQQYCVTATVSASDFSKWAAWSLALVGACVQLPWIFYIPFYSSVASVTDNSPLAFNKLPQLEPRLQATPALPAAANDSSGGCGIIFAPTNQSGTLQVPALPSRRLIYQL
jgi:hypothetical protein